MSSFGESLKRERELRGIELRDIADATKISLRFLQAIEQDRLEILPGGIFPKAFVRQYARHLGLDADRLVAEFVYTTGAAPVRVPEPPFGSDNGISRRALWLIALVALVGIALYWRQAASTPAASAAPGEARATPPPLLQVRPSDRVYPAPTPDPRHVAPATSALEIKLVARRNCWVGAEVDGVRAIDRVLAVGEGETLKGREIVLSLGNAGGLDYTINGQPGIALGGEGEVRRNVVITRDGYAAFLAHSDHDAAH